MKKAFAWLEGQGIEYRLHDYKKDGAPERNVKSWIDQLGWEALVNTKGMTFRKLPRSRQEGLNASKAAALMVEFPSVIRRPVVDGGKTLLVGFDPERYAQALSR